MDILVDSWSWLNLLEDQNDPCYRKTIKFLDNSDNSLYTTILNIYEVYYRAIDRIGDEAATEFIVSIKDRAKVVFIDEALAMSAAKIHKTEKLSSIDAFGYAAAMNLGAQLLTGDPDFKGKKNVIFID